jgi:uncharacterized RDD family membrane protein YckC
LFPGNERAHHAWETSSSVTEGWQSVARENDRFAGLWPRFLALLVDLMVFCAIFFPITRLVKGVWIMSAADHRWNHGLFITDPLCIAFLVVMILYFVLLEGLLGVTLGKWVVGLRVERIGGGRPGLVKGLLRNVLRIVDGLPAFSILGIVLVLTSDERARFGDRIAGTRVIRVR